MANAARFMPGQQTVQRETIGDDAVARGRCLLEPHSMRGRATVRDLSVFAGWFGLPNDEFLLPWRSISAEQPGGLDTKATGPERTHAHRCRTHHR